MTGLFWNIILATCWVFLSGSFEALNYFFGFVAGYLIITIIHTRVPALQNYPHRIPRFLAFIGYFFRELLISNIKVAIDVVTPPWHMTPGVIRFKTAKLSNIELTLLANLISLTPGTLVLDVSEDKKALFVHTMFLDDYEKVCAELKELENRFLRVIR